MNEKTLSTDLLVVGAGIAGISTALETAETGFSVTLIEKNPNIGGRVAQLNHYFPKLCPPSCGLEINFRRLRDNPLINMYTLTELVSLTGTAGNYKAKIKIKPRYIKANCQDTALEKCSEKCSVEIKDDFNYGMNKAKAVHLAYNNAFPMSYYLDKDKMTDGEAKRIADECPECVDLAQEATIMEVDCKAVVFATGWKPYDANNLDILGYKDNKEVVTNVELERLASPSGPTGGKITVPGSGKEVESIAFVQCAGSRDETHLEYCSSICCLATVKHAHYIREQYPDAKIYVFYIDLRATGAFEKFIQEGQEDENTIFSRGKVAKVFKDVETGKMIVEAEDTMEGGLKQMDVDMVVLATGMQPAIDPQLLPDDKLLDENGFIRTDMADSIIGCGVATAPKDVAAVVQEATGAAMKAIHIIKRSK